MTFRRLDNNTENELWELAYSGDALAAGIWMQSVLVLGKAGQSKKEVFDAFKIMKDWYSKGFHLHECNSFCNELFVKAATLDGSEKQSLRATIRTLTLLPIMMNRMALLSSCLDSEEDHFLIRTRLDQIGKVDASQMLGFITETSGKKPDDFRNGRFMVGELHESLVIRSINLQSCFKVKFSDTYPEMTGTTPESIAKAAGDKNKAFLEENDIDMTDINGWTPLHHAVFSGDAKAVAVLMDHGARMTPTASGKTPLDIAEKLRNERIISELQSSLLQRKYHSGNDRNPTPL